MDARIVLKLFVSPRHAFVSEFSSHADLSHLEVFAGQVSEDRSAGCLVGVKGQTYFSYLARSPNIHYHRLMEPKTYHEMFLLRAILHHLNNLRPQIHLVIPSHSIKLTFRFYKIL